VPSFDRALLATFGTLAAVLLVSPVQVRGPSAAQARFPRRSLRPGQARPNVEAGSRSRSRRWRADQRADRRGREIVERAPHRGQSSACGKTPLSVVVNRYAGRDDPLPSR
jgi:hypothetical protein